MRDARSSGQQAGYKQVRAKVVFSSCLRRRAVEEAVVQIDGVTLVISDYRRPYHDIVDFTRLGLQPKSFKIIVVKSGYLSPELSPLANPEFDGAVGWFDQSGTSCTCRRTNTACRRTPS